MFKGLSDDNLIIFKLLISKSVDKLVKVFPFFYFGGKHHITAANLCQKFLEMMKSGKIM